MDATHIKVHPDGANPAGGQAAQAMGRTKDGLNTKLHAATDDRAQPQSLILTAGPEADVVHAPALLDHDDARHVLMDKAYDSDSLRELIAVKGMKASSLSSPSLSWNVATKPSSERSWVVIKKADERAFN